MQQPLRSFPRLAPALLVALFAVRAPAQEHLGSYLGETVGADFGLSVTLGDLDGDGVPDHVVSAPGTDQSRGRLRALSGASGLELWHINGALFDSRMGTSLAGIPDVDGDGLTDLAIGSPGTPGSLEFGRVAVRSGVDGALITQIVGSEPGDAFGAAVGGLDDVNGDGRGDLLLGAPFADGPAGVDTGAVYAYSARDGILLAVQHGGLPGDQLGSALQGTIHSGDGSPEPVIGAALSGDGSPEPVIGATQAGNGGPGYALELSPIDFSVVRRHDGLQPGDRFGASVALAGDLDADGAMDVIVGAAPRDASGIPQGAGYARAFSGASGLLLLSFSSGQTGDDFGASVAGIGDVNGDGHDDLAVGSPASDGDGFAGPGAGTVRIYRGQDGALTHVIHGAAGSAFGSQLAFAGDVDGDGLADCAVGAPHEGGDTGTVFLFSLARWTNLYGGVAGSNGMPRLTGSGVTAPSATVQLTLKNAAANANVLLVAGSAMAYDPALGLFTPTPEIVVDNLQSDANGQLVYDLLLPAGLPLGAVLNYQYVISDAGAAGGEARTNVLAGRSP